jgi:hypothetical protein
MIKNALLKTFWIEPLGSKVAGFGVTAFSCEDAFQLLNASGHSFSIDDPQVRVTEGIRVEDLDHVVPNMGPVVFRGVWYPCANL